MFFEEKHYALAPLENHVRVYASSVYEMQTKLVKILNLVERIVWQNRPVDWGII